MALNFSYRRVMFLSEGSRCFSAVITLQFFLLIWLPLLRSASGSKDLLDIVEEAFINSNEQKRVRIESSETIEFHGVRDKSGRVVQRDETLVKGDYILNRNAIGLHDFELDVSHMRWQILPKGGGGGKRRASSQQLTEKSVYKIRYTGGELLMNFLETTPDMQRRLPRGWFRVENFKLGHPVTPAVSYLKTVDLEFIFEQYSLLDMALTKREFVETIEVLHRDDAPVEIPGSRCYSLQYRDPLFVLRTSLSLSVKDFSGFGFSDNFKKDMSKNAEVFFKTCLDPKKKLILFAQPDRGDENAITRIEGHTYNMTWSAVKGIKFEYVEPTTTPAANGASLRASFCFVIILIFTLWILEL